MLCIVSNETVVCVHCLFKVTGADVRRCVQMCADDTNTKRYLVLRTVLRVSLLIMLVRASVGRCFERTSDSVTSSLSSAAQSYTPNSYTPPFSVFLLIPVY